VKASVGEHLLGRGEDRLHRGLADAIAQRLSFWFTF